MGIKYYTDKSTLWIQVRKEPERPVGEFFSDDILDVSHYYGLAAAKATVTGRPITQIILDDPLQEIALCQPQFAHSS